MSYSVCPGTSAKAMVDETFIHPRLGRGAEGNCVYSGNHLPPYLDSTDSENRTSVSDMGYNVDVNLRPKHFEMSELLLHTIITTATCVPLR